MTESAFSGDQKHDITYFVHLLYQGNPHQTLSKQQIIEMTQGAFPSEPDVRQLFEELPDRSYDEQELSNTMSKLIKEKRAQ